MPLHLLGEHEYAVGPLATPPPHGDAADGQLPMSYPAVRLFVERAQAAQRAFDPTPEMLEVVGRITALLMDSGAPVGTGSTVGPLTSTGTATSSRDFSWSLVLRPAP